MEQMIRAIGLLVDSHAPLLFLRPRGLKVHTAVTIVFPRTAQGAFELRRGLLAFVCFFATVFRRVRSDLQGRAPLPS